MIDWFARTTLRMTMTWRVCPRKVKGSGRGKGTEEIGRKLGWSATVEWSDGRANGGWRMSDIRYWL